MKGSLFGDGLATAHVQKNMSAEICSVSKTRSKSDGFIPQYWRIRSQRCMKYDKLEADALTIHRTHIPIISISGISLKNTEVRYCKCKPATAGLGSATIFKLVSKEPSANVRTGKVKSNATLWVLSLNDGLR